MDFVESLGAGDCEESAWRVSGVRGGVREGHDVGLKSRQQWPLSEVDSLRRFGDGGRLCVCSRLGQESARFMTQLEAVAAYGEGVS